ncbi:MAG: hypothetical protein JNL83_31075, partial [Myxococcales bacterium]|nr:hypothetical protein [Myxococcales bacterium]
RELCPDGGCVGVIGPDGHCKVCKRAVTNWGNERERGLKDEEVVEEDGEEDEEDEEDVEEDEVDAEEEEDDEYEEDEGDDEDDDEDDDGEDDDDDEDGDYEDDDPEDDDGAMDAIAPSAPAALGAAAVWTERQLCPDGGCIGVLGDDGLCKVCGKGKKRAVKAAPAPAVAAPAAIAAPATNTESASKTEEDSELVEAATELAASLVEDRKLCPDGACVGVIGADGKCKVCGKEAA